MKNSQKITIISLIMFSITSIGITFWYISDHILMNFDTKSIIKILSQVGLPAGVITTLMFLVVVFLLKRIKNLFLSTLSMALIFILFIFISYWFILHMIFYHIEDKESFVSSLFRF
ncbi:hypothetical protein [Mucilaginibacter sp. L196]|uniref:hypothetical protein n=1 Tax=Mucilaginibacter sp. L196 TaxID=1641870 RepID=UPI00131A8059|nr:hypothetical protein [Mucilaginibacter sp. L196]